LAQKKEAAPCFRHPRTPPNALARHDVFEKLELLHDVSMGRRRLRGRTDLACVARTPALFVSMLIAFSPERPQTGGSVFGDQCSPISDTTILSSLATGCDLMDHVTTQLPMALGAAGLAAILYTVVAAGMS